MSNRQQRKHKIVRTDEGLMLLTPGPVVPLPDDFDRMAKAERDTPPGEHLWIMVSVYRIHNPQDAHDPKVAKYLDLENLLSVEGPGCYRCEQTWTADIGPCPGAPS